MSHRNQTNITVKPKMGGKEYEKELHRLQVELCKLQNWVKYKGLRIILVLEGRDGAGKGGAIKALTERVSPRIFRTVALPAPSDREKTQMYMQRYLQHFPAAGEIVIFDRSWYNRAGVDCDAFAVRKVASSSYRFEGRMAESSYSSLAEGQQEQERSKPASRTHCGNGKPAIDSPRGSWYDYLSTRQDAEATDTEVVLWYIVRSDDKGYASTASPT
jgi:polyphosphate kinase 2 (PPK2 family)